MKISHALNNRKEIGFKVEKKNSPLIYLAMKENFDGNQDNSIAWLFKLIYEQ